MTEVAERILSRLMILECPHRHEVFAGPCPAVREAAQIVMDELAEPDELHCLWVGCDRAPLKDSTRCLVHTPPPLVSGSVAGA